MRRKDGQGVGHTDGFYANNGDRVGYGANDEDVHADMDCFVDNDEHGQSTILSHTVELKPYVVSFLSTVEHSLTDLSPIVMAFFSH